MSACFCSPQHPAEQEVLDQGGGWSGFFQGLGLVAGGIAAVTGVGDILDISIAGIEGESLSDVAYAQPRCCCNKRCTRVFIDRNALACTGFALAGLGEIGNYLYDSNKLVQGLAGALGWAAATSGTVLDGTLSLTNGLSRTISTLGRIEAVLKRQVMNVWEPRLGTEAALSYWGWVRWTME